MYIHDFKVKMHHTDAAGVAFFAQFFLMAHEAYEAALDAHGAPLGAWLHESPAPLVHTEADYLQPLRLSDLARVRLGVEHTGTRSFTTAYAIEVWRGERWESAARLKFVHVTVAPGIGAARALPEPLRAVLNAIGPLTPTNTTDTIGAG
jgi:1,4-dihydroxy-2-naphthoyl-CoA hydrolase